MAARTGPSVVVLAILFVVSLVLVMGLNLGYVADSPDEATISIDDFDYDDPDEVEVDVRDTAYHRFTDWLAYDVIGFEQPDPATLTAREQWVRDVQ